MQQKYSSYSCVTIHTYFCMLLMLCAYCIMYIFRWNLTVAIIIMSGNPSKTSAISSTYFPPEENTQFGATMSRFLGNQWESQFLIHGLCRVLWPLYSFIFLRNTCFWKRSKRAALGTLLMNLFCVKYQTWLAVLILGFVLWIHSRFCTVLLPFEEWLGLLNFGIKLLDQIQTCS